MQSIQSTIDQKQTITIIYDGDCPVCKVYIRYARLQKNLSPILINARQAPDFVNKLEQEGIDIDEGMVVIFSSRYYHGADAIHLLSSFTTRSGLVNRLNILLFRNSVYANFFYPILLKGRSILLCLLNRKPINYQK